MSWFGEYFHSYYYVRRIHVNLVNIETVAVSTYLSLCNDNVKLFLNPHFFFFHHFDISLDIILRKNLSALKRDVVAFII